MTRDAPELEVVANEDELADVSAERFLDRGQQAISRHGRFDVALAGGSTPKAAYALLATRFRDRLPWSQVRFFFGDERCVSPEDDRSNYKMARTTLLEPLGIAPSAIFRMHGEDTPAAAAEAYANVLREELGEDPSFDLIMLGMGPDGHTASLFPGADPFVDDDALVRAPYVEKFNGHRLTLTPHVINGARAIVVSAGGPTKADALHRALDGRYDPVGCPIQILKPRAGTLTWLVDLAATSRLDP